MNTFPGGEPAVNPNKQTWKLTREQWDSLRAEYRAGATTAALAEKYGLQEPTIRDYFRRNGEPLRAQVFHTRLTEENIEAIVSAVADGACLKDAYRALNIQPAVFYDWIKKGRAGSNTLAVQLVRRLGEAFGGICPHSRPQRKRRLNEFFFDKIDTEEKAWLLGFIATDGCVHRQTLSIGLASRDAEILHRIVVLLESDVPITERSGGSGNFTRVSGEDIFIQGGPRADIAFHSKRLCADLVRHGISSRKTFSIQPWQGPAGLLRHYWRGVIDGDGSLFQVQPRCSARKPQWGIACYGNRMMVQGCADFFFGLTGKRQTVYPTENIFALKVTGTRRTQQIVRVLYEGARIALPRKQLLAEQIMTATVERIDRSSWSHEWLEWLKIKHGTWTEVAKTLGVSRENLCLIRTRARERGPGG